MKRMFIHNAIFRLAAPLFYGIIVYLLVLMLSNNLTDLAMIFSNAELYVCITLTFFCFEALRLNALLFRKINFENQRNQILITALTGVFICAIMVWFALFIYFKWAVGFAVGLNELLGFWAIFGITALLYNVLYFSHGYLHRENTLLLEQEAMLKEKTEQEFQSFRNEINPDLLYESLESVILAIHANNDTAEDQIDLLANVYRYQLTNRKKEIIEVEEEIRAMELMLNLLNFKYNGSISMDKDLEGLRGYLLPGSLVTALDTIVRNTLISTTAPLKLKLYTDEDMYLVLQHKLNNRLAVHQESLQYFTKLQRTYSFFTERPFVQVKADGEHYVKFPLILVAHEIETETESIARI